MSSIKVGFVIVPPFSWLGGFNYIRNLLGAVRDLDDPKIQCVVLTSNKDQRDLVASLFSAETIGTSLLERGTILWLIRKLVQRLTGRDYLFERFLRDHGISVLSHSGTLGASASIPTITWIPDFQHRDLPEFFEAAERMERDRSFSELAANSSRIILSSEHALESLHKYLPSAALRARVLKFVGEVGKSGPSMSRAEIGEKYGITDRYFHLPNQFWAHKNHRIVIDALAILERRGLSVMVLCTGSTKDRRRPHYYPELVSYAEKCGVGRNFRVLGVIPYEDMISLMTHSLSVINPSFYEGWSTTVEEAKALGKRVLLSDIRVHREQDPLDGLYFPPTDASALADRMEEVLRSEMETADSLRKVAASRQYTESRRRFARSYETIVLDVLDSKP